MITNEKLNEIEDALTDDATALKVGRELGKVLRLRKSKGATDSEPRFQTSWGSKTEIGLARSVVRLIADSLTV